MKQETKEKIRQRRLGKKWDKKSKEKMRKSALEQVKSGRRKGLFTKGHKRGMTGKHHSSETIKKIIKSNTGKTHERQDLLIGKPNPYTTKRNLENNPMNSKEARIKNSIILKKKWTEKEYRDTMMKAHKSEKRREKAKINRANQVFPMKDTSIEVKIQNLLNELGIKFITHQYIKEIKYAYQCDILIPIQEGINKKTIIECDGDYWHGNLDKFELKKLPNHIKFQRCLDFERTEQLEDTGFRVIRLWGDEINKLDLNDLKNKILEVKK